MLSCKFDHIPWKMLIWSAFRINYWSLSCFVDSSGDISSSASLWDAVIRFKLTRKITLNIYVDVMQMIKGKTHEKRSVHKLPVTRTASKWIRSKTYLIECSADQHVLPSFVTDCWIFTCSLQNQMFSHLSRVYPNNFIQIKSISHVLKSNLGLIYCIADQFGRWCFIPDARILRNEKWQSLNHFRNNESPIRRLRSDLRQFASPFTR